MKRFLYFSISVGILCACGFVGFPLWKNHQTQKESALAAKEKRARLDKYYSEALGASFYFLWERKCKPAEEKELVEGIHKMEAHMIRDGYDRADISEIRMIAQTHARETIEADYEREKASRRADEIEEVTKKRKTAQQEELTFFNAAND